MPTRNEMVVSSPHGHHKPNTTRRPLVSPVNSRWSVRTPPVFSATSRTCGGALTTVFIVHSLGKYCRTTARASASSSVLNEEATHENRLSQLKPPLIQAFLNRPHISNRAAEEEPPRTSMPPA